jgi:hypothetical protein
MMSAGEVMDSGCHDVGGQDGRMTSARRDDRAARKWCPPARADDVPPDFNAVFLLSMGDEVRTLEGAIRGELRRIAVVAAIEGGASTMTQLGLGRESG